jgi:predicted ATP-grasp superfamily ATP-dependent carboligase
LRILVCEYVTGGGLAGRDLPPSLAREGDMMLAALVKDLGALAGIEVLATRDSRLPPPDFPARFHRVEPGDDPWAVWRALLATADAFWPVAPEQDGILESLSLLARESGRRLIGCRPPAIRLTASKRATAEQLAARGVAAVPGWPPGQIPDAADGWVVKPDRGAGCEDTILFRRRSELEDWLAQDRQATDIVVQPYMTGPAGSLSVLYGDGAAWLLACNRQKVALRDGRFHYLGGVVGGFEAGRGTYRDLAESVGKAIDGLWGYVGIDFVAGRDGPVVLEINPRLTTSYVGLHRALGVNPAGLVLDLLDHGLAATRRPLACDPVEIDLLEACHA